MIDGALTDCHSGLQPVATPVHSAEARVLTKRLRPTSLTRLRRQHQHQHQKLLRSPRFNFVSFEQIPRHCLPSLIYLHPYILHTLTIDLYTALLSRHFIHLVFGRTRHIYHSQRLELGLSHSCICSLLSSISQSSIYGVRDGWHIKGGVQLISGGGYLELSGLQTII